MRVAHYNALRDRDPATVKKWVQRFLDDNRIDVMTLNEGEDYFAALGTLDGYKRVGFNRSRGQNKNYLLVRAGLDVADAWPRWLGPGWFTVRGGLHPPLWATHAVVEGVRFVVAHMPPTVDWKDGKPVGPSRRVKAYLSATDQLAQLAKHQAGPLLINADWNEGARDVGPGSPGHLARRAGLTIHPTNDILFGMSRGLARAGTRIVPVKDAGGSDHPVIVYIVGLVAEKPITGTISQRVIGRARRRGLVVLSRGEWGSTEEDVYARRRREKPHSQLPGRPTDTVVQHITVTRPTRLGRLAAKVANLFRRDLEAFKVDCRAVERIGMQRFGSGVSYNWLVDMKHGFIAAGQPLDAKGTHTVNDKNVPGYSHDLNKVAIAIAVVGMPDTPLTATAKNAITQLVAAHIDEDAVTDTFDYDPHSKFAFKDCPCDPTRTQMPSIKAGALRESV
jgi:hypothetical protein